MGQPGKVKRDLTDDDIKNLIWAGDHYVEKSRQYLENFRADD